MASLREYSEEAIDYLSEVGFGVEFGELSSALHRWNEDVKISVHGDPTDEDLITMQQVTQELNGLVADIDMEITTDDDSNLEVHFLPESQFARVDPRYVPVNYGFFRVWWDDAGVIYRGRILISSQGVTQRERAHLIREELTQSLGLFQDSWRYEDSIFYEGWTETQEYSSLDRQVIEMYYSPGLQPGMDRAQVLDVFAFD